MRGPGVLTARDIMTTSLVTLDRDTSLLEAMQMLTRRGISGAPVVDRESRLVGILSEADCLRAITSGEYYSDSHYEESSVQQYMTKAAFTIPPELGIYRIAQIFLDRGVRRLPVVEGGDLLLGQVSRRDVLRGIDRMRELRKKKRYPDYPQGREPHP